MFAVLRLIFSPVRGPSSAELWLHLAWWHQLLAALVREGNASVVVDARNERNIARPHGSTYGWKGEHDTCRLSFSPRFTDDENGKRCRQQRGKLVRTPAQCSVLRQTNPSARVRERYPIDVGGALRQHLDALAFVYGLTKRVRHDVSPQALVHEVNERLTQPVASQGARPRSARWTRRSRELAHPPHPQHQTAPECLPPGRTYPRPPDARTPAVDR
jgi:hypothetical protein